MRRTGSVTIGFLLTCLAPTITMAGSPTLPTQLYGKSISVKWSEDQDLIFVSGEKRHAIVNLARGIYVSGQGRMFVRSSRIVAGRSNTVNLYAGESRGPNGDVIKTGNSHPTKWEFHGRSMVEYTSYESGARRLAVNFDESFRSCTFDVTYGKQNGVPGIVAHSLNYRLRIISLVSVTPISCTVTDGNMFGGGDNGQNPPANASKRRRLLIARFDAILLRSRSKEDPAH